MGEFSISSDLNSSDPGDVDCNKEFGRVIALIAKTRLAVEAFGQIANRKRKQLDFAMDSERKVFLPSLWIAFMHNP
jgi:hypothetical protein